MVATWNVTLNLNDKFKFWILQLNLHLKLKEITLFLSAAYFVETLVHIHLNIFVDSKVYNKDRQSDNNTVFCYFTTSWFVVGSILVVGTRKQINGKCVPHFSDLLQHNIFKTTSYLTFHFTIIHYLMLLIKSHWSTLWSVAKIWQNEKR